MFSVGLDAFMHLFVFNLYSFFTVIYLCLNTRKIVSLVILSKKVEKFELLDEKISSDKLSIIKSNNELPIYKENEIKEIILGSLLGDGNLEKSIKSINARFGFIQSTKARDYFIFLYSIFSPFCSTNYRDSSYLDSRTNKSYS